MDFFARQDQARQGTKRLVMLFALAVLGIVATVNLAVAAVFLWQSGGSTARLWNPALFGYVSAATLAVIGVGSLVRMAELARGGGAVAEMLGGRKLSAHAVDPDERKLLNVVEEMSLASGVPMPDVYVLDQEEGVNAFAAGNSTSDAAIGVTRGCIRLLKRDELQGVIAHEFSHVLNGDMRLNLRLMGLIFGILCLTIIGRILLRTRGRKNPLPLLGLLLLIIGGLGVFFGRMIQSAVSRQREFLADASAVQFTRNPDGLAGALKKIGGLAQGSQLQTARAGEASHLFFGNGMKQAWSSAFATHPPLEDRIRAIDPGFDGRFTAVAMPKPVPNAPPPQSAARAVPPPALNDLLRGQYAAAMQASGPMSAQQLVAQVGQVSEKHLAYAADFEHSLPDYVHQALREPAGAAAVIYALTLSNNPAVQQSQQALIQQRVPAAITQTLANLLPLLPAATVRARLPLVMLAVPALRGLSPPQYLEFRDTVRALVEIDQELDLFEYALLKVVGRHLAHHFEPQSKPTIQYYALKPLVGECQVLLSALARIGSPDAAMAETAYQEGIRQLPGATAESRLLGLQDCGLVQIDSALNRLAQAAPGIKKTVLLACAYAAAADGVIQRDEAELLRAIADTLDCPIPPFVSGV